MDQLYKILFYKFLSRTLNQGLSLSQAVRLFAQESSLKHWQILHKIEKELARRKPLSSALAKTKQFSVYELNFLRLIEQTQSRSAKKQHLSQNLLLLSEITYQALVFKKRIKSCLLYPLLLACGAFILFCALFFLILPRLAPLLRALPSADNLSIKIILILQKYASAFFSSFEYPLLFLSLFILLVIKLFKSKKSRIFSEIILLNLPVLGNLLKKEELSRLCLLWAQAIAFNQNKQASLNLLIRSTKWKTYQLIFQKMTQTKYFAQLWRKPETTSSFLSPPLSILSRLVLPPLFRKLIELGEHTQSLEDELKTIAQLYQDEVEADLKHSLAFLEPLLILALAAFIGIIAYSAYSAYWQITGSIFKEFNTKFLPY